ncbi:MAG TPA: hypothetical protein VF167_09030 [Longimicrobiaceae bacterium]
MQFSLPVRGVAVGLALALAASASPSEAQTGRGFLFDEPNVILGARGGFGVASAGSDLFDFVRQELTLSRGDFNGFSASGDVGVRVLPRLDLVASVGYVGSSARSESRDWEGEDDLPILQRTEFRRVPLTAGVRLYPLAPGRSVGRYAWIPARLVPYVGAAAGGMWYRFRQTGEFVDESTDPPIIFEDELDSNGWAPTAEAFAGLEYTITPRMAITGEGRYTWAEAEPSDAFEGFDPIDLAGFVITVGVSFRQ